MSDSSKYKNGLIVISIFFLILVFIVAILELLAFNVEKFKYISEANQSGGFFDPKNTPYTNTTKDFDLNVEMRPTVNFGTAPKFLLFGCSFTYGANLENKETFSYQLAKNSSSTVYNKAYPGWGAQQMLYQLEQENFYKEINSADYIIYTYIDDHINRLNYHQWGGFWGNVVNLRYKEKDKKLVKIEPLLKPLWHFFLVKEFQFFHEQYLNSSQNEAKNIEMFNNIMKESLKLSKKHYPNSKFIFLIYSPCVRNTPGQIKLFKMLEKEGFIVVKTDDITKEDLRAPQYHFGEDCHPTAKAWSVIAPALIKKLNL